MEEVLERFRQAFRSGLTWIQYLPAREAIWADFPPDLDVRLRRVLEAQGIHRLYAHQAETWQAVREGRSVVVVTPTASGKTLCYNLPVLQRILEKPRARAMYLFPTKALAQDQKAILRTMTQACLPDLEIQTYDGDTPEDLRAVIRERCQVVLTNPDMLHTGILPHHVK
ncbi:MAG: DEAD/DEAH box helicase, partial [Acidobacteria bacterium]|nr:DEAD/DEAH box helicase [Acidobacteriota bacterium]MDW7985207.1 DEAD/DEAH box helicase [Acidobacteriota bacterium]